MKRFLMYVVVLIGLLFVGFTTYYFVMNKENIYLNFEQDSTVYYNIDESFTLDDVLTHTDPYNETTKSVECADQSIVQYNAETQTFTTLAPGSSNITITTNNPDFARFAFNVVVCDGSTTELAFAVKTAEDLAKVGSGVDGWNLDKHYRLVNNIDLNTPTTSNWTPIGLDAETGAVQAFTGEFLGYDNTISNLNITNEIDPTGAPTLTYAGLFAELGDSAVVESVFFNNCTIDGTFAYAGLVAATSYGKIGMIDAQNIVLKNNATIESPATMGGIVGNASIYELNGNLSARPEIYMCQVSINELSGVGLIGGLVGSALGTIISDSNVTVRSGSVSGSIGGGIAGMFACYIKEGSTDYRFGIIQNVYAITQFDVVGAQDDSFVGNIVGFAVDRVNDFDMANTYTNVFMNSNGFAGVGRAMLLSADLSSGDFVELEVATALTDTQLKDQSSYTGFDFEGIWGITEGSYAHLTFELASYNHIIPFDVGVPISSREGAVEAFNAMREHAGVATTYTFSLTENIVLTPADFGGNAVWAPIGTSEEPFAGTIVFTTPFSLTLSGFTVETTGRVSGIFG